MATQNVVMIPVRLDALRLGKAEPVAAPMADWTWLPYTDLKAQGGAADINPNEIWASVSILAEPFEQQELEAGVHLSWALPDALTLGHHPEKEDGSPDTTKAAVFPAAPDRWLVVRRGASLPDKRWVIESDYLWPEGAPWMSGLVSYPVSEAQRGDHQQPWRYIGRAFDAGSWKEESVEHLMGPLTAIGWGEPLFAAFYPNCQGVFGLHDPDITSGETDGLIYEIYGWYSTKLDNSEPQDPLAKLKKRNPVGGLLAAANERFQWSWGKHEQDPDGVLCFGRITFARDADEPAPPPDEANIEIVAGNTPTEALSAYLSSKPAGTSDVQRRRVEDQLEAFHLMHALQEHSLDLGPKFREARHARGFSPVPGGAIWNLSLKQKEDAPHEATAEKKGTLHELPPILAHRLNSLNEAQSKYDRGAAEVRDLRRQVFATWHKYITCAHHLDDERGNYPDIDIAKRQVERLIAMLKLRGAQLGAPAGDPSNVDNLEPLLDGSDLGPLFRTINNNAGASAESWDYATQRPTLGARLHAAMQEIEFVLDLLPPIQKAALSLFTLTEKVRRKDTVDRDSIANASAELLILMTRAVELINTDEENVASEKGPGSLADRAIALGRLLEQIPASSLAEAAAELATIAEPLSLMPEVAVVQTPAPRFYQPNNPSLLLVGDGVEATDRHGEDGMLFGQVASLDLDAICNATNLQALTDGSIKATRAQKQQEDPHCNQLDRVSGNTKTNGNGWHPLAIDWEVRIYPLEGNVSSQSRRFSANFIDERYALRESDADLSSIDGHAPETIPSTSYLTGRSILTESAGTLLSTRIEDYLEHQIDAYCLDQTKDLGGLAALDYLDQNTELIQKWAVDAYKANLADVYVYTPILSGDLPAQETARQTAIATCEHLPASEKDLLDFFNANRAAIFNWIEERRRSEGDPELESESGELNSIWPEDHVPLKIALDARAKLAGLTHKSTGRSQLQAQSLGGFNEALLMHRQVLQLKPDDPLSYESYLNFSKSTVANAIGVEGHSAPLPHFDFHPLRTGKMELTRLRLIDSFGRVRDLKTDNILKSVPLASEQPATVALPPRITQPARVQFRWLSALDDVIETNAHPISSPVCGWLVPNLLDGSVMIYDGEGLLLGLVDISGHWRSSPGREGPIDTRDIPGKHLSEMASWLCRNATLNVKFIEDFLDVIETATENIDPESFAQHESRALLMGRPLALVRACVNLELQGLPSFNQSWNAFMLEIENGTIESDDFVDVSFPVRIGEHCQLNDGVVGYWLDDANGDGYQHDLFYAPQSDYRTDLDRESNVAIFHDPKKPLGFSQSISSAPQPVSILLDPRCAVHCATGILPAKSLRIPAEHYARALERIRVTFLTSPILTTGERVELPLPAVAGFEWSWVQKDGPAWSELTNTPIVDRDRVIAAFVDGPALWEGLIQKGWLEALDPYGLTAVRVYADQLPELGSLGKTQAGDDRIKEIVQVLDLSTRSLGPAHAEARFAGQAEIREGFLQLQQTTKSDERK